MRRPQMLCDLSIVQLSQGAKYMIKTSISSLGIAVCVAMGLMASAQAAVDVEAAKALAKANDCLKCHAADKDKKGPSMKKIAAKYKGKPDGQEKAIKNMTEGQMVKLSDGTEEKHKIIDTKDPKELKNMADWYLSH
jgi:cytochrome c